LRTGGEAGACAHPPRKLSPSAQDLAVRAGPAQPFPPFTHSDYLTHAPAGVLYEQHQPCQRP
jgi:hypothetical protein